MLTQETGSYFSDEIKLSLQRQIKNLESLKSYSDPSSTCYEERCKLIDETKKIPADLSKKLEDGKLLLEECSEGMWGTLIDSNMFAYGYYPRRQLMTGVISQSLLDESLRSLIVTAMRRYTSGERYLINENEHNPWKMGEFTYGLLFVLEDNHKSLAERLEDSSGYTIQDFRVQHDGGTEIKVIDQYYRGWVNGSRKYHERRKKPIFDVMKEDVKRGFKFRRPVPCYSSTLISSAKHLFI